MAIKASLHSNGHRGLKLRFKAFGTSWCPRFNVEQNVVNERMIVCGDTPQHLVTETNKVVVRYRFLDGVPPADQGFSFRYNSVGSRCDETKWAIQGVLQTPGYP